MKEMVFSLLLLLMVSCSDKSDSVSRINPLDSEGELYMPPIVEAMQDTVVAIYDTIRLSASGSDDNGFVEKFVWQWGGVKDTTLTGYTEYSFDKASEEFVIVRCIDDHGLISENFDTINVSIHEYRPFIELLRADSAVALGDSVLVTVSAVDTNGRISGFEWSDDLITFSPIHVSNKHTFKPQKTGIQTFYCRAYDDDNLTSLDSVSVNVLERFSRLITPINGKIMDSDSIHFSWESGFYNHSYSLLCDTTAEPNNVIASNIKDSIYSMTFTTGWAFSKEYSWRVVSYNELGESDTSNIFKFITPKEDEITLHYGFENGLPQGWETGGTVSWVLQDSLYNTGKYSLKSGHTSYVGDTSWVKLSVEGPILVEFYAANGICKFSHTDNEGNFSIDGVQIAKIRGVEEFKKYTYTIDDGNHVLEWAVSVGSTDILYLDDVSLIPLK